MSRQALTEAQTFSALRALGDKTNVTRVGVRFLGTPQEVEVTEDGYIHLITKSAASVWHFADRYRAKVLVPFCYDTTIAWTAITLYDGPRVRAQREASCQRGRFLAEESLRSDLVGELLACWRPAKPAPHETPSRLWPSGSHEPSSPTQKPSGPSTRP
jgi:hypothetical protein